MSKSRSPARSRERRKKVLKEAKGYWGARGKVYKLAKQAVLKARDHAYRDRKRKKRDFRKLWITRISAACKERGTSYSRFIGGLKKNDVELDRKQLSEIAVRDPEGFDALVELATES